MAMTRRTKKTKDIACYEKLRNLLLSGGLRPGTRIGETEWSERLDGNPAALREAMARLADQGLLRRGERGGYFVPEYSDEEMAEIYEVRAIIGVGAIKIIGRRKLNGEQLQPLADICDTMEHVLDAGLEIGYREADRKFHNTLVELAGNKRLSRTYRNVALPILHSNPTDPEERRRMDREGLKTHREIYQLLVKGRYEEAAQLLEEHIKSNMPIREQAPEPVAKTPEADQPAASTA